MSKIYIDANGNEYPSEFITVRAQELGMSAGDLIKQEGLSLKSKDPVKETAVVGSENLAVNGGFGLENGSLDLVSNLKGVKFDNKTNTYAEGADYQNIFQLEEEEGVKALQELYKDSGLQFEESNFQTDYITDKPAQIFNIFDVVKVTIPGVDDSVKLQFDTTDPGAWKSNLDILEKFTKKHEKFLQAPVNTTAKEKYLSWENNNQQIKNANIENTNKYLKSDDLFDVKTRTIRKGYSSPYGGAVMSQEYTVVEQPYEKELNQANTLLSQQYPNLSTEQLEEASKKVVRNQLYEQAMNEAKYKAREDAISDGTMTQEEMYVGGSLVKSDLAKEYNIATKKLETLIDTRNEADEIIKIINSGEYSQEDQNKVLQWGAKNNIFIDPMAETVVLENGQEVSSSFVEVVNQLNTTMSAIDILFKNISDQQNVATEKISDTNLTIEAASKNYDLHEKYLTNIGLGFADITVGGVYLAGSIPMILADDETQADWNKFGAGYSKASQEIRNSFVRDVQFNEAFKDYNFGKFLAQEISNQIPIISTMILSGGTAAPYVIGATTAGGKMMDMQAEISNGTADYSPTEVWLKSLGYGAAEGVFAGLTTVPILTRANQAWINAGKEQLVKNNMINFFKSYNKKGIIFDGLLESGGEVATVGVQNLIDGNPFTQNMDHAGFSGFGFGIAFAGVPFLKGIYNSKFTSFNKLEQIRTLQKEINDLGRRWETAQTENARVRISEMIAVKSDKLADEIKKQEDIINNNLTERGGQYIFNIINKQAALQNKAQQIANDPDLSQDLKKKQIAELQEEFDMLVKIKNHAVSDSSLLKNETEFAAFEALDKLAYDNYIDAATQQLNDEKGGKPSSENDIKDRAYDLYFGDQVRAENSKQQSGEGAFLGKDGFISFETRQEANNYIDSRQDLSPEDKQKLKDGINSGNDGAAVEAKGNIQSLTIAVVENQVANQRKYTRTHEVGHQAFWEIFKNQKNESAFDKIADQLLVTLKATDKATYDELLRDSIYVDGVMDPAEVISKFLEYVAGGKITNVQKAKGISGLFGVMVQKTFAPDYDFNFKGEQDIFNFVVGLAQKIKSGQLTTKDIIAAKETEIVKKLTTEQESKTKEQRKGFSLVNDIQSQLTVLEDQLVDNEIDFDTYEAKLAILEKRLVEAEKQEAAEKAKPKPKVEKKAEKAPSLKEVTAKTKETLDKIGKDPKGFDKNNPKIYEVLGGMIRSKSKVFRTTGGNVVNLTNLPGFEMENMISETIASMLPLINKFDPAKNDSLYGYINAQLANRMRAALKTGRVTEQKFTEDVTEMKKLAAEETVTPKIEKPKYTKIIDADVFDVDVTNSISDKMVSTVRVLKNKLITAVGKNQNTSPLIAEILSDISRQADIDIKKAMGGKKDGELRRFLLKNKQAIIENLTTTFLMGKDTGTTVLGGLPIAIQKQIDGKFVSYPDWIGKKIDRETAEKRGATAGNQIVRRVPSNKISDADYLSFFLEPTGNPIRGRKEALAKELAGEIGLELFVESAEAGSGPIFEAFEKNQEILGAALMDNYMGEITKQAERGTIKFSLAKELKLKYTETKNILLSGKKSKKATARYLQELEDIVLKIENEYDLNRSDDINTIEIKVVELIQNIVATEQQNRGLLAEQEVLDVLKTIEKQTNGAISIPKGFKTAGKRGGIPDIIYYIKGINQPQTLEVKLNTYAALSTLPAEYVSGVGEKQLSINFPFATKEYNDKINKFLNNYKPYKEFFNMLTSKNKEGLLRGKVEQSRGKNIIAVNDYTEKNKYGFFYESKRKVKEKFGDSFEAQIELPFDALNEIFAAKNFNTFEIQFMDAGLVEINPETILKTKNKIDPKNDTVVLRFIIVKTPRPKRGGYSIRIKPTFFLSNETRNKILANEDVNLINVNGAKTAFSQARNRALTNQIISDSSNNTVFLSEAIDPSKKEKGISIWDFDDTLATTKSNVLYTLPDGTKGKMNAEEFAKQGDDLLEQGAEFDFSEFSKVMEGRKGPMFEKAIDRNKKFGNKNVYILTARPANSASAIHEFLKGIGLDVRIENIIGLGNSTAQAKAEWVKSKVAEGYNDFYFADDAYKNVKAVQDVLNIADVKSKVQQAYIKFSAAADPKMLNKEFNQMLERSSGIKAGAVISKSRAEQLSKGKGRFALFLPPNAEDFQGLIYKFLGKGAQGNADMEFFKDYLFNPFNAAENAISSFRQKLGENLKILNKELGNIDKDISNETIEQIESIGFTPDQAVRVFVWNRMGEEIPDLTKQEKAKILGVVRRDAKLMAYARELMKITEQFGGYPPPSKTWFAGNSKSDLYQYANENVRAKYLENWQANADAIFSPKNMTKIEAIYGKDFAKNLKEILRRMKAGSNRPLNLNDTGSQMLDYINGSVGTIMFLNMRSATLQTISAVNFLNWSDNNIFKAGATLANPKEFVETFMEIMNSDFLKQRRNGLEINVSEAEIAKAVEQSKNKAKSIFNNIIKFGYKPTQFADSFAIASGGTSFLINRTKTYEKQGLSFKEAREKAFTDFRAIAEENQQSSRTDRTSNIQASNLGRLLFAFNNTPFQYTRLIKKAVLDLANNRGDWKTNVSKIMYYGAIQNILFFSLQQALMAFMFGADEEEEDLDKRKERLLNSTADSILRGSGLPGAIVSTVKNVLMKYQEEVAKGSWKADYGNVVTEILNFSPPTGSKAKRVYSYMKGQRFAETEYEKVKNFSKLFSAVTNVPMDRVLSKYDNLTVATNEQIDTWKRIALVLGWDQWSLDIYDDLKRIEEGKLINKAVDKAKAKDVKRFEKEAKLTERQKDSLRYVRMQKRYGK